MNAITVGIVCSSPLSCSSRSLCSGGRGCSGGGAGTGADRLQTKKVDVTSPAPSSCRCQPRPSHGHLGEDHRIRRTGREGLICQDNIRAESTSASSCGVNKTVEDVHQGRAGIGTQTARTRWRSRLLRREVPEALSRPWQAAGLRRSLHQARGVPGPDHPGQSAPTSRLTTSTTRPSTSSNRRR